MANNTIKVLKWSKARPSFKSPEAKETYIDLMKVNELDLQDIFGEVSEMWNQSYKLEKKNYLFFLKTSLVYLGTSPDTIGKISWPLKEAILEAQTFSQNFEKFGSKLLGALETSFFHQYASVIPFWKALKIQILDSQRWKTSEVIRGR